ncbi:hypothetical protein BgiBS90_020876, partial [Biomphalaria glabrata]
AISSLEATPVRSLARSTGAGVCSFTRLKFTMRSFSSNLTSELLPLASHLNLGMRGGPEGAMRSTQGAVENTPLFHILRMRREVKR